MSNFTGLINDLSTGTNSQRGRTVCLNCIRRKVKCSKTVPCTNCLRRGEEDSCSLEPVPPTHLTSQSAPAEHLDNPSNVMQTELESLRRQVSKLHSQLQHAVGSLGHPSSSPSPALNQDVVPVNSNAKPQESSADSPTAMSEDKQQGGDAVVESAASILEFLTWGKRKNPGNQSVLSPEASISFQAEESGYARDVPDGLEETSNTLNILQLLLPNPKQVWQLVDYHEKSLLWCHNSYYAPTFRKQLKVFYDHYSGYILDDADGRRSVNLQWIALLFSILTGSMTCAPSTATCAWGFKASERELLSKKWFYAVISSLNKAEYTAKQSIFSVQAISTLTISAHILGNSNTHAVHIAAAVRISQGLGLHRLTDDIVRDVVEKETGRRVWAQLCNQDWFSTSFYETYLINPIYSSSMPPINCHDDYLVSLSDQVPTIMSYTRFLTRIAAIMPLLQDELVSCNTAYTRYDQVLKWDKRLRALVTAELPPCLSNCPIEAHWPQYIPWARRALAISSSHKIIMIHRSFLIESFVNPAFAFTRRTCLAASKTIIKEYKAVLREDGPIMWTHQAFSVAAAITLALDVLHRDSAESEFAEHKELAEDVVDMLSRVDGMIASRGSKLLPALLKEVGRRECEVSEVGSARHGNKRRRLDSAHDPKFQGREARRGLNLSFFVSKFCNERNASGRLAVNQAESAGDATQDETFSTAQTLGPLDDLEQNLFSCPTLGLEGGTDFENLLYLANHDIPLA